MSRNNFWHNFLVCLLFSRYFCFSCKVGIVLNQYRSKLLFFITFGMDFPVPSLTVFCRVLMDMEHQDRTRLLHYASVSYTVDSRYTLFRYPRFRISAVLFQYYEENQYPIRGKFLKPLTWVEPTRGLSENVMQMISLASKNSGASLTSKWRLLYVSLFTRFRYTRRFVGTQPPCKERVTCTSLKERVNMEATRSLKKLVTTRHHNPGHHNPHFHRCDSLKSRRNSRL
jgi:hypothetical protein